MNSKELLAAARKEGGETAEEMTFAQYLDMVAEDPKLARHSHALVSDMIEGQGMITAPDGSQRYKLFDGEVFGHDRVLNRIAEYFHAAGRRLDVRKRILLLLGPPGSGKSTIVNAVKRGLEAYTRTDDGRVFAVKDSQMHEDPLRLIPPHLRDETDVHIEGDLNPEVRWMVRELYDGDIGKVPVERIYYSIAEGLGFGTYVATDPRSEDLTRLVGEVDMSQLLTGDRDSLRRAFRFDGELNAAHRGMADLIEIFKMDERFLSVLLSLSQEQMIKTSGPGTMYADEAVVAQSNLAEFQDLIDNPKAAAMLDRLVVVKVPYVLSVRDEVQIYEKMLEGAELGRRDVSPLAIRTAATFAVLTRIDHPGGGQSGLLRKLHLYDQRYGAHGGPDDERELRAKSEDEGMTGVSPRYVINVLSSAAGNTKGCLTGMGVLEALWEGLPQRAGFDEAERERWAAVLTATQTEYEDMVKDEVRRASVVDFRKEAGDMARTVREELEAWHKDETTAQTPTLRKVERLVDISQFRRKDFRQSLADAFGAKGMGRKPLYLRHPQLEQAVDKAILPSWNEAARKLEEQRASVESNLSKAGWNKSCVESLLEHVETMRMTWRERKKSAERPAWFS